MNNKQILTVRRNNQIDRILYARQLSKLALKATAKGTGKGILYVLARTADLGNGNTSNEDWFRSTFSNDEVQPAYVRRMRNDKGRFVATY